MYSCTYVKLKHRKSLLALFACICVDLLCVFWLNFPTCSPGSPRRLLIAFTNRNCLLQNKYISVGYKLSSNSTTGARVQRFTELLSVSGLNRIL